MQLHALRRMRRQVAELAMEDSALLEAARQRRQELESELSAVRSQEDALAGKAHSSGGCSLQSTGRLNGGMRPALRLDRTRAPAAPKGRATMVSLVPA